MPRTTLRFDPIDEARRNWTAGGWDEAAPGMALVTSVMRVHQILLAQAEQVLRPLGLTFARYELLMLLHFSRTGRLPLGKIGQRLQVHPASVTNAADGLERDGLVRREPNPLDGRGTLAAITPAGRRLAIRATDRLNRTVFEPLADGADDLVSRLTPLRRAAGDFADPEGPRPD